MHVYINRRVIKVANIKETYKNKMGSVLCARTRFDGSLPGGDLVPHLLDHSGRRADEPQTGVNAGLGKVVTLGQEAVARVHRVHAVLLEAEWLQIRRVEREIRGPRRLTRATRTISWMLR